MDLTGFSDKQRQALLDLLIFGMYLDGNLSSIEDLRISDLLDSMKFESEDARRRFADASYTRARQRSNSPEAIRAFVAEIAKNFPAPDLRRRTFNLLESLLASDKKVVERERELLTAVKKEFKLGPR